MGEVTAGKWRFEFWTGGYPVQCQIYYDGKEVARVQHHDLDDLLYVLRKGMREVHVTLPDQHRWEVALA